MIDFADVPKVTFEAMNTVHAEEVEMLNRIETLLGSNASEAELSETLDALFIHTREHFANEERLMREAGFPPYEMHKSEHDRVLNAFQLAVMDWRSRKDNAILHHYFCVETPEWLHQHIASMDTVTARFIAMVKGA